MNQYILIDKNGVYMRKLILIAMSFLLLFVGCSSDNNKHEANSGIKSHITKDEQLQKAEIPMSDTEVEVVESNEPTICEYLVETEDEANLVLLITNQSFKTPKIRLEGIIDDGIVFNGKYKVKDQHEVTNYYVKLPVGKHTLKVASDDANLEDEFEIEAGEKLWMFISYWSFEDRESLINIHKDNKRILIK